MVNLSVKRGRVGISGLMVAAAMTETLMSRGEDSVTRIPTEPNGGAR